MPATADYDFKSLIIQEYDAVLVPGGWAPDKLRRYPEVLEIIRTMNEQKSRSARSAMRAGCSYLPEFSQEKVTSTPGIKDDMTNAGAQWLDEAVVTDGHIVSSRRPPDLPQYAKAFADLLAFK